MPAQERLVIPYAAIPASLPTLDPSQWELHVGGQQYITPSIWQIVTTGVRVAGWLAVPGSAPTNQVSWSGLPSVDSPAGPLAPLAAWPVV